MSENGDPARYGYKVFSGEIVAGPDNGKLEPGTYKIERTIELAEGETVISALPRCVADGSVTFIPAPDSGT